MSDSLDAKVRKARKAIKRAAKRNANEAAHRSRDAQRKRDVKAAKAARRKANVAANKALQREMAIQRKTAKDEKRAVNKAAWALGVYPAAKAVSVHTTQGQPNVADTGHKARCGHSRSVQDHGCVTGSATFAGCLDEKRPGTGPGQWTHSGFCRIFVQGCYERAVYSVAQLEHSSSAAACLSFGAYDPRCRVQGLHAFDPQRATLRRPHRRHITIGCSV